MNRGRCPFQALIFDLDGTLIDSAPDVCASVNRVFKAKGRRELTLIEAKDMIGWGGRVLMEKALAATGDPGLEDEIDDTLRAFLKSYADHPAKLTTVFPGAVKALETFKTAGVKLGICTNKPTATTLPSLKALRLDGYFDVVSCGDAVPHKKPDGRHVLLVVEQLGATVDIAAMVGDSETDIYAATDAGVRSICVTFGYAHVSLDEIAADAFIDRFEDLPRALRQIAGTLVTP